MSGTRYRLLETAGEHPTIFRVELVIDSSSTSVRKLTRAQVESKRGDEELLVPSHSPPGLTQTIESMREDGRPVEVGRRPKPAPLMLHQSPHWLRMF